MPSVLHIVESLDRGAVETWLVRMLEHATRRGIQNDWTFYCQLSQQGALEARARASGARVVHSPVGLDEKIAFARALRDELRRREYDVLHCHHDLVSAVYLAASAGLSIARRIVHVHNADEHIPTKSLLKAGLLREPMRRVCLSADRVVGISNHTLETMLAGRPRRLGRDSVHYYGVNSDPFVRAKRDRVGFRTALGLARDALILLFGGRITPEKNPVFAVDVLAALAKLEPRVVAVFAGSGSLEVAVNARAIKLGVSER
ncbi:MAG: glycosyltransferase, partial [Synechococcus sp.]|nr:glycosyltransferase [Synechococcus sp.]